MINSGSLKRSERAVRIQAKSILNLAKKKIVAYPWCSSMGSFYNQLKGELDGQAARGEEPKKYVDAKQEVCRKRELN